jgi:hypothetical protein
MQYLDTLLPYFFVLRFPLLTLAFLLAFPIIALRFARSLLANLFDLTAFQAIGVSFAACALSWTSVITGFMMLTYGNARFGLRSVPVDRLPNWIFPVVFALAVPLLVCAFKYSVEQNTAKWTSLILGGLTGFALFLPVALFVHLRYGAEGAGKSITRGFWRGYKDAGGDFAAGQEFVFCALFVTFAIYLSIGIFKYWQIRFFRHIPSLAYMLLLVMVFSWILSGMSFFLDAYRVPVVFVLIVYLLVITPLSSSDHYYHVLNRRCSTMMPSPHQALDAAGLDSVIVVAANGGGIQSSAWSARVLTGLDKKWRDYAGSKRPWLFAKSVRAISSVSGGSVGSMLFTDAYSPTGLPGNGDHLKAVNEKAGASRLDDIAWGLVYPDLWRTLTPFRWGSLPGRGRALEHALIRASPGIGADLSVSCDSVAKGDRPANIFNATLTESGGRFVISNAQLSRPHPACSQFYELYKQKDLSIASAARLSATFPYVTPAARADLGGLKEPQFHVVDGGYYDNYGMATLAEWVDEALQSPDRRVQRVLILQVLGFPPDPPQKPAQKRGWFYQLYAPIETMFHARSCGQIAHNDVELPLLAQVWGARGVEITTATFRFEPKDPKHLPPLSWHLTNRQRNAIEESWNAPHQEKSWEIVRDFLDNTRFVGEEA